MTRPDADGHDMRDRFKYLIVMFVPVRRLKDMRANRFTSVVLVLLLIASSALTKFAASTISSTEQSQGLASASNAGEISYSYRFENPRFYIPKIEIDLGPNGAGQVRFTRGESDEVMDLKVKLLPATVSRIRELFEVTGFLGSDTDYQDKKNQFPHIGWMTLGARQGANERKVRFN